MQTWTLDPVVNPWLLAVIGGALSALLLLRPRFGLLNRFRRSTLIAVRAVVVILAMLLLLRPGCITTVEQQQKALLLMLIDTTRSMQLSHQSDETTRWQRAKKMLAENRDKLAQLEEQKIEVKVFGFDSQMAPLEIKDGVVSLPEKPEGGETDIGTNIDASTRSARNQRLIGLVLLSDGQQTALDPRVELIQAARTLNQQQTPLYTVPFGRPADSGQFADIAVKNMPDNYTGFVKNRQTFSATVSARGFANRTIPVQLLVTDPSGNETVVDTKTITFRGQDQQAVINLGFVPETAGQYRVKVKAAPQPEEISPRNNELPAFLTVFDGGLRVLYVTGNDGYEQHFFRRAIESSREIEIVPVIIAPGDRSDWPLDLTKYFNDPSFDVFFLADIDSRALYKKQTNEENLKALVSAVNKGKGLIMTGGYHSFGPGLYADTPLEDVLPILMDITEKQDFDAALRRDLHIERKLKIRPVDQHFLTNISNDEDPQQAWQKLQPLEGANQFLKIKDNARVLLKSEAGDDILVSTTVTGRVLAFAGDTTWKWAMGGNYETFKRFWRQIILWLAFRDSLANDNVWINLPQRRYQPRSVVVFSIGAKNVTGQAIEDATFQVRLVSPDQKSFTIPTTADERGGRQAQIDRELVVEAGLYSIEVVAKRGTTTIGSSRAEFIVFDQDKEKSISAADPDQLRRLADQTSQWGGESVTPDEFSTLLDKILQNPPEMKIEIPEKWRLGDTWQDGLCFILLFVSLLGIEWGLRKKWGMV